MLLFAESALDKAKAVPTMFWVKVICVIVAFILAVLIVRWIATRVPKMILIAVGLCSCGIIFFSWIYNRNEPAFLTPTIEVLAQWFPSKDGYEIRQAQEPGKPGLNRGGKPTPTPRK